MKTMIANVLWMLLFLFLCVLVERSVGYENCTESDIDSGNVTRCIVCKWKTLLNSTINNCTDHWNNAKLNITVCVKNSTSAASSENVTVTFNFNISGLYSECADNYPRNLTCTGNNIFTTSPGTPAATDSSIAAGTDETTATEKPLGSPAAEQASAMQQKTKSITVGYTKKDEEVQVTHGKPNKNGGIGSTEEPLFKSDTSKTEVQQIQIGGNITESVRVVVLSNTSPVNENPKISVKSTVTTNLPEAVSKMDIFYGEFLAIEAFASNTSLSISGTNFDLDVSKPLSQSLIADAKRKAGIPGTYYGRNIIKEPIHKCTFFDGTGALSDFGCKSTSNIADGKLSCECNHATVFACLISVNVVTIPAEVKIISYIFEILSIFFLIATLVVLVKVRHQVRGDRVKVQICLSACLLALHVVNVLHDAALLNNSMCELWAVLTQFFLLSSAMWMLMEGLTLLFKTMDSVMRLLNGANAKKFALFRYIFGFAFPALIVMVTASVGFSTTPASYLPMDPIGNNYIYQHCWLGENMLLGGVVIPIAIILSCSALITMRVCYVVYRMSSESDNYKPTDQRGSSGDIESANMEHMKAALKATLVLFPVLGIPWFLGFFTAVENGGVQKVFMYLNAIVNGLQGVMLFFVYCVLGKEVRKSATKLLIRGGYNVHFPTRKSIQEVSSAFSGNVTYSTKIQENTNGLHESKVSNDEKTANEKL